VRDRDVQTTTAYHTHTSHRLTPYPLHPHRARAVRGHVAHADKPAQVPTVLALHIAALHASTLLILTHYFFTCRRHRDRVVRRGLAMMFASSNRTLQCIAHVACLLTRLSVYCAGSRATSTRAHAHSRMRQRDHPPLPALAKTDRLCFLSCPVPTPAASTLPARAAH